MSVNVKELRKKAHSLKAVVRIGNLGVTKAQIDEISRCLYDHELIKVRIVADSKESKKQIIQEISESINKLTVVQEIGHLVTIYKPSTKKKDLEKK